jgi:hypothetical protein
VAWNGSGSGCYSSTGRMTLKIITPLTPFHRKHHDAILNPASDQWIFSVPVVIELKTRWINVDRPSASIRGESESHGKSLQKIKVYLIGMSQKRIVIPLAE